jgi:hypothetical protein
VAVACDISVDTSREDAFKILDSNGFIPDVLVNSAGISSDSLLIRASPSDVAALIDTNLVGTMLFTKGIVRSMLRARRGGCIVTVGSVIGSHGGAGQTVYAASKVRHQHLLSNTTLIPLRTALTTSPSSSRPFPPHPDLPPLPSSPSPPQRPHARLPAPSRAGGRCAGGAGGLHQGARARAGRAGRAGQPGGAGLRRHRHDRRPPPRAPRGGGRQDPAGPHRHAGCARGGRGWLWGGQRRSEGEQE